MRENKKAHEYKKTAYRLDKRFYYLAGVTRLELHNWQFLGDEVIITVRYPLVTISWYCKSVQYITKLPAINNVRGAEI